MTYEVGILASQIGHKDGVIQVSTTFLEEYFDVSRQAIHKWPEKGCPQLGRGKWDLIAVIRWRDGAQTDDEESSRTAYLRKIKAEAHLKEQQAQIAEIELGKMKRSVIEIEEVEQIIGSIIMNTKGLLQALPSKAAPRLLGLSSLDDLKIIIEEHRERFIKANNEKSFLKVVDSVTSEFCEARSIAEINDVLKVMIHEALTDLSDMRIEGGEGSGESEG